MRRERTGLSLRRVHEVSGLVVGTFVAMHLANHLAALRGVDAHIAFMRAARHVYRQPAVEVLLLVCVAFQAGSGMAMAVRNGWPRTALARVQAASGFVVATFLAVHVGAVLAARGLLGMDTDFHFAAAGLHAGAWAWFFAPYYVASVLALFVHLGCAAERQRGVRPAWHRLTAAAVSGALVAGLIVLCLAGVLTRVEIPPAYLAMFPHRNPFTH